MVTQTDEHAASTATNGLTVQDAITEYVMSIPDENKRIIHPELSKFARWIGGTNSLASLRPSDISPYSETFGASASEANKLRIAAVKDFLNYAKKKGYIDISLAPHIPPSMLLAALPYAAAPAKFRSLAKATTKWSTVSNLSGKRPFA